jgi:hypothetical protein
MGKACNTHRRDQQFYVGIKSWLCFMQLAINVHMRYGVGAPRNHNLGIRWEISNQLNAPAIL